MWLPKGHREPTPVYLVEWPDDRDGSVSQLGAFSTETAAQECVAQLEREGWTALRINLVGVHERLADWQRDR